MSKADDAFRKQAEGGGVEEKREDLVISRIEELPPEILEMAKRTESAFIDEQAEIIEKQRVLYQQGEPDCWWLKRPHTGIPPLGHPDFKEFMWSTRRSDISAREWRELLERHLLRALRYIPDYTDEIEGLRSKVGDRAKQDPSISVETLTAVYYLGDIVKRREERKGELQAVIKKGGDDFTTTEEARAELRSIEEEKYVVERDEEGRVKKVRDYEDHEPKKN